jgi:hypothetical protein
VTLVELIAVARREFLDDTARPYLWSDEFLRGAANRAVAAAARGGHLLRDSITPQACHYTITASEPNVKLHASVFLVARAVIAGKTIPLDLRTVSEMDEFYPGWEDSNVTMPIAAITDYQPGYLRLYPPPDSAGTLRLQVFRVPLRDMEADDDEPEIPDHGGTHRKLCTWIAADAHEQPDSEGQDMERAKLERAQFYADFGVANPRGESIRRQIMHHDLKPRTLA